MAKIVEINMPDNEACAYWKVTHGEKMTVLKSFWMNGEGWYLLRDSEGKRRELPDVFFMDLSGAKGSH